MLGVAELVAALASAHALSAEQRAAVAGLVPAMERGRLFLGKGGELMRGAAARCAAGQGQSLGNPICYWCVLARVRLYPGKGGEG